ncbi:MAG: DUF5703 domain-containing protein [Mediterranea sp.]|nr:DUF5703 domain-containing protein [Mediterranea sp.]
MRRLYFFFVSVWMMTALYGQPADVVWTSPSRNSSESMPCGGGDIGMNVWVEGGDVLFYLSRSGTLDANNTLLKQGRFRLRLSPNPFEGATDFRQTLRLHDGYVEIAAAGTQVQLWTDVFHPVVHVEVAGGRPLQAELYYESWRYRDRLLRKGEGQQCSYKWAPPKGCVTGADSIIVGTQPEEDATLLTFYHRNAPQTVFDETVTQQGLDSVKPQLMNPLKNLTSGGCLLADGFVFDGTANGVYAGTDYRAWKFRSARAARRRQFCIVLHTLQAVVPRQWELGLEVEARRIAPEGGIDHGVVALDKRQTRAWWNAFWQRSFIVAEGEAGRLARNYTLFRYMLGCNARGSLPTKFNGGLFTFDPCYVDTLQAFTPDYRKWSGGTMTAQNQRLVYWPLLKSGDFDLMLPQFNFYLRMLPNAELRSRVYWHHAGACFSEQIENYGLPNPAEYGFKRPAWFDCGLEYNAWLEYEWDTVLEFCQMILETRRYADANITPYLPLIESSLTFFDEHYRYLASHRGRKALDGDGHLILFPGSACETYKMTNNAASTIAALRTVLQTYGRKPEMLRTIPPIPLRYVEVKDSLHPGAAPLLKRTIAPAVSWERVNNVETPQLYPVFPWRIYGVGKADLDIARNTYLYDPDALKFRSAIGWKQDNIWAACLGLTDEAKRLTEAKLADGPFRFPAFWGPGFDWAPDHNWGGSGMIGLQEMLLQTDGDRILLFPAWPREWNVHFKLHAPRQTTVEAILKEGKLTKLKVTPSERQQDVVLLIK